MAELERIRSWRWILIAFIAVGMIGFLIPYDAVLAMFGQGANREVGQIGSTSLSIAQYQQELQDRQGLFNYQTQTGLKNEVWNDLIERSLLTPEYEELGLTVNQEEFDEIRFGEHISPYVQRTFYGGAPTDETRDQWRNTFSEMFTNNRKDYDGYAQVITAKRKREKYDNLVKRGLYANSLEARYDYQTGQEKVNIKYVVAKYDDIPDSAVTVSESQVRAYYNKHKNDKEYQQKKSRDIKYVLFSLEPSKEDLVSMKTEMTKISESWGTIDNDEVFASNQDNVTYTTETVTPNDTATLDYGAKLYAMDQGGIIGPLETDDNIEVIKILDKEIVSDSTASVRHILLKADDTEDEAEMDDLRARADSIKRRYKAGEDWDDLCSRFSEDPGSKDNGGKYEYFPKGQMVAPFEEFAFNKSVGSIGAVETNFGIHLMEVLDQRFSVEQVTIGKITRVVEPSEATRKAIYDEANDFSLLYDTEETFLDGADTLGYSIVEAKSVRPSATNITGLKNPGRLLGWIYKAEKGEVSNPQQVDGGYAVALLTKVMENGVPPFENVTEVMKEAATKEAKGKKYADLMAKGNSLEEVAADVDGDVKTAMNVSLKTNTVSGSGVNVQEPRAVGLSMDRMSLPIIGEGGIWVVSRTSDPAEVEDKGDYFEEQDRLTTRLTGAATTRLFNAIKDGAEIEDNRDE